MPFILERLQWDELTRTRLVNRSLGTARCAFSTALCQRHICSAFCGGKNCLHCHPFRLKTVPKTAIAGLRAAWITPNILATSRPSTSSIKRFDILQHFRKYSIVAVFNLQDPFEHDACGDGVGASGFSYDPYEFMNRNIYFYNFRWPDYGCGSLEAILDAVTIMQSMIMQGKVAIHCHAGLGRTGVLIACYLIFNNRVSYHEAIQYVRYRRPGSIQTELQIKSCQQFEQFIAPNFTVFGTRSNTFTLTAFLKRQSVLLHDNERKRLRYIPRILYFCYKRLTRLARGPQCEQNNESGATKLLNNSSEVQEPQTPNYSTDRILESSPYTNTFVLPHGSLPNHCPLTELREAGELNKLTPSLKKVVIALLTSQWTTETKKTVERWKAALNNCPDGWDLLEREAIDVSVVVNLLFDWLTHLKSPVVRIQDFQTVDVSKSTSVLEVMEPLEMAVACVLILTARFIVNLGALPDSVMDALIVRFVYALCQIDYIFGPQVAGIDLLPCLTQLPPITRDCSTVAVELMQVLTRFVRDQGF